MAYLLKPPGPGIFEHYFFTDVICVLPISFPFLSKVSVFTMPKPGANHSVDENVMGTPILRGAIADLIFAS